MQIYPHYRYSVAVVDNPIYDVDPDEKTGAVAYYKSGHDDDDDEEALVKVYNYAGLMSEPKECFCPLKNFGTRCLPPLNPEWIYNVPMCMFKVQKPQRIILFAIVFKFANEPAWLAYRLSSCITGLLFT